MTDDAPTSRANIVLHLDNGAEMQFSGRPFAGVRGLTKKPAN